MKPVRPLNQVFKASAKDATELWQRGVPLIPVDAGNEPANYERIRRSVDGQWVVRKTIVDQAAQDIVHAMREHEALRKLGIDIISHAHTAISKRGILSVTPWVEGMKPCPLGRYERLIKPVMLKYFEQAALYQFEPYLSYDIALPEQYSVVENRFKPFLHDVDPLIEYGGPAMAQLVPQMLLGKPEI